MDFQFVLPQNGSDLLNSSGDSYYVKNVYSSTEIPERLKVCKQMIFHNDPFYIFDHFDTYFAVTECSSNDPSTMTYLMRSFDLLYVTVDKMCQGLSVLFASSDNEFMEGQTRYLNLTKMTLYLFTTTVKKIDTVVQLLLQQQQQNQQKKRGKQGEHIEQYPDWDVKRNKFLVQLFNVIQLPLEKLWKPPVADENFVNMVCDICYRTIEILHRRPDNKHIGDTVFQIFGTAIKRYNHAITFPVRILQLLRTVEHSAVTIASGIHLLHEEYGISTIFSILLKDIVEALTVDSADTMVSRNFSNFLSELAVTAPKLMIPHLSTLAEELLNCESHVLRNCILQIMGDAIMGELTSEEMNDELKEARNEFLHHLLTHINDVSAHVRAKVLQVWKHMKEENAVPLTFQLNVLREAVERLEDKTSSVRKAAVQLIKAFLESNPFAAKLTLEELLKKYDEELEKMEKMRETIEEEREHADQVAEQWNTVIPDVLPLIEQSLKETTEDMLLTQETHEDLVKSVSDLLVQKDYKKAILLVRKADFIAGNAELSNQLKFEEQCTYFLALLRSYVFIANGCKDSQEEFGTQIKTVSFLKDSIEFSRVLTRAMPKMLELLLSKVNTDLFEAVDLFTTGYLFGIKGTEVGMQKMLLSIWSSDKEKRDAVSNAYKKVLFSTDQTGRAHAIKVVQNLSQFIQEIEYGHYTALECLIREWVSSDDIDAQVVQVLFERFTMKLEGTTPDESMLAQQILIVASQEKATIASANISVIEAIGLGERGNNNAITFARCLEFLVNSVDKEISSKFYNRYEPDSPLVQKVVAMFHRYFCQADIEAFDDIAIKTMEFIYHMCQKPDIICEEIIVDMLKKLQMVSKTVQGITASQQAQAMETPYSQPIPESQPLNTSSTIQMGAPAYLLTRFIFTVGYITLKEMIFLDIDVYNNMKYRQELTEFEKKKNKKKNNAFDHIGRRTGSLNMSAMESLKRLSCVAAEPQQEPDEELVGATAEDNIAELINHICEDVLLYSEQALLGKIIPFVVEVCKYPAKYKNDNLQQAATLTLIRFMSVSSVFCESNMPFLMNILQHTKNIKIKCNIVIGLSDLTFRFPNVIEPWTGHFYSTLHEEDTQLRLTAVKMLSHLVLHEMIRVKGQIADLAMCIVDPDDSIKNITQTFFKEIANKSNILYNVLPDIISKLSDTSMNLQEEKYRIIMRYILGLIQKDRQVETLVEKLCLRFPVTREERQWRDIAFCLSLLTYNERALRKLIDNIHYYKDKVQIDEVYQSFKLILSNTAKLAKPEIKTLLTELENRINECLEVRENNTEENADSGGNGGGGDERSNQTNKKTASKKKSQSQQVQRQQKRPQRKQRGRGRAPSSEESSTESSSSSDTAEKEVVSKSKMPPPRPSHRQQRNRTNNSTAHANDSQEESFAKGKSTQQKAKPIAKTRTKIIEDTASSEDEDKPQSKRGRSMRK